MNLLSIMLSITLDWFPLKMKTMKNIFPELKLSRFDFPAALVKLAKSTILFGILLTAVESYGQRPAQTGAIDDGHVRGSADQGIRVWAAPAEQKIRPDDRVENSNLVWNVDSKKVNVAGAGNERVPFQVVITTSVSGSSRHVKSPDGFFIKATELVSESGSKIPASNIKFFLQHYIMLYATSSPVGATGYWPDALAPIKVPFGMNAHYHVVQNRPIWVDLFVPSKTPAGKYTGTITVTQHDKTVENLTLEVNVYNFSLPDETPLITYINVSRSWLAGFYHKPSESQEIEKLTQTYYKYLYENRMEPWFNDMLTPEVEVKGNKVTLKFNDERYKYYMNELKTKRVLLHAYPGNLRRQIKAEPFSPEFKKIVQTYLSQIEAYFRKNGWQDRLVYNSPIDEPRSLEEYEDTRKWAALVKEATPNVPFLITRTPVPVKSNPEWGTFQGYVDNYSVHGNHMNDPELKRVIQEEKASGGEITWYISCDQRYPQPNYFIDAPALDLVMVPWITARYDMDGILYWAVNFWSQTPNPWLDAGTFHSGFLCSGGWVLNGEGSLWYPGDHTERYTGQPNVDGPISSLRFELLREGIEDYVYLWMLKELGDKEFAEKMISNHVVDVKAFSRNLEQLYLTRKAMAKRLEELSKITLK
jgi:hypothetical protein